VEGLLAKGHGPERPAMSGLGYRQICAYLMGEIDLPSAVRKIKTDTHRFVRQQYKWFRLDDETIHWFDMDSEPHGRIEALVRRCLEESA
jgi:tRNA dimethylallyltransferase